MKAIKSFLILLVFFTTTHQLTSQTIYSEPALPNADEAVMVYFDATSTPLEDYSGNLYTHTGVIIEGSSNWHHVIGNWGNNSTQPQLTSLGNNLYKLDILPTIRDFYDADITENIVKMAFVFRSEDAETQTQDLFVDVFGAGLNVRITIPDQSGFIVEPGDEIIVEANAIDSDSLKLYHDDILISFTTESSLRDTLYPTDPGIHWVKVIASTPAIACCTKFKFVFVLSPHVPAFSPVTINSSFRSDEKLDAII